jgi:hypothetical protein
MPVGLLVNFLAIQERKRKGNMTWGLKEKEGNEKEIRKGNKVKGERKETSKRNLICWRAYLSTCTIM